jgi:hypothetical protein
VTQYTTRRELREAERKGLIVEPKLAPVATVQPSIDIKNLTRRQMKEMGIFDDPSKLSSITAQAVTSAAVTAVVIEETKPASEPEVAQAATIAVFDVPATEFTGQSFLAEPTTASIVLERAPEAISIPIDTAEIAITGSIAVVTDPITSPSTATFDGAELDQIALSDDAVTGVMSVVEPISALELIEQRADDGVVPTAVLRKGWWKAWAIGIGSVLLAVGAAVAIFLIFTALGAD